MASTVAELRAKYDPPVLIRTVPVEEFIQMELPPRKAMLFPALWRQGLTMIHAPRGIGKTFVSIGMTVAVASAGSFLNWRANEPCGVLFLDGEMPAGALKERINQTIVAGGKDLEAPIDIFTPDLCDGRVPDLSTTDGQAAVDTLVTDHTKLIVVDNLSCFCRSGRENEGESWISTQDWALSHRAQGRTVLFIHHSNKNGSQRGTSRREDVLDTVIGLRKPHDFESDEPGTRFAVVFEKSRNAFGQDIASFEAKLATDEKGRISWATETLKSLEVEQIREMARDGMKIREIAQELGMSASTVCRRLNSG